MNPTPSQTFLKFAPTKVEAQRRLRILKDFLNFIAFQNQQKLSFDDSILEFKKNKSEDISFLNQLGKDFFNQFRPQTLNAQFDEIEKSIEKTKIVKLYLPFDPPETEIEKLGAWFKTTLGAQTLFEINFDPSLIGGCALSFNGVYKDYSLKQKISDNKSQVIDTLLSFKSQTQ